MAIRSCQFVQLCPCAENYRNINCQAAWMVVSLSAGSMVRPGSIQNGDTPSRYAAHKKVKDEAVFVLRSKVVRKFPNARAFMLSYASTVWRRGSHNENQPYMKGPEEVVRWLHRCYVRETNW